MTGESQIADPGASLSAEYLEFNGVVPLSLSDDELTVGSWRPVVETAVVEELSALYLRPVRVMPISEQQGKAVIQRTWGSTVSSVNALLAADALDGVTDWDSVSDLRSLASEAPVIQLVNLFLLEALSQRASDVHLESTPDCLAVRYRIDGVLQDADSPPLSLAAALLSRLKIMARLDIAERRMPQDGRIRLRLADRDVDVRVSSIPTLHGESMALRLLDARGGHIGLVDIGMPTPMLSDFKNAISKPQGMVLVTGPTGSGKTTTLYAAIEHIRNGRDKILTIEDPVEYQLSGVSQMPIDRKQGVTFANALRAVLRHDPDVLMVGEIRDTETAEVATQAALTGHLVFSTLHTNDAIGVLARLLDLGVDRYLVAATLNAVLAQRLVRRICQCVDQRAVDGSPLQDVASPSCSICHGCGYYGRIGVYELLLITEPLRGAIQNGTMPEDVRLLAKAGGFQSILQNGEALVELGVTTREEVRRVVGAMTDTPCTY